MVKPTPQSKPYQLQEPVTGLYVLFEDDSARLTYARHASRFATGSDALIAAGRHAPGQPVELVRGAA